MRRLLGSAAAFGLLGVFIFAAIGWPWQGLIVVGILTAVLVRLSIGR